MKLSGRVLAVVALTAFLTGCSDSPTAPSAPSWHLENVTFAESTIEVCDAVPSFVESSGGPAFALGTYCPWSAVVIGIKEQ